MEQLSTIEEDNISYKLVQNYFLASYFCHKIKIFMNKIIIYYFPSAIVLSIIIIKARKRNKKKYDSQPIPFVIPLQNTNSELKKH